MAALRAYLSETWQNAKALGLAVVVHALAAALIVLGTMDWKPMRPPQITGMTIEAVMVDTQALQAARTEAREAAAAEERAQEAARQREERLEQRQRELAAQREREAEAAKVEEQRRQAAEAERQRQAELRLQQLREQQERERQAEIERQQRELEELQRQRAEAEKQRKLEEERLKQLEARREEEAARQRQAEAEAALQEQLAAEAAAQRSQAQASLRGQYIGAITAQVTSNWYRPPTAPPGLRCRLRIVQLPGGDVISAQFVGACTADEATRRSIIAAAERAALPYRGFEEVFEREIDFDFVYDGD
ncbi:cell envelope integrity protein TolA [Marinihelvus fidelis]|uniref:Cell envelope integrity protein TolA n=1 Tax=Marinihelvus fidelis TaxID=2613842 RepID=A0A5N0TI06_9GAMM|nr:cell envelope integrity protein TolA [Marinihelvus fidelis]KAA9133496.1 cell envelope integrity protein TolA [Marinihelvus fidelis]